MTTQESLWSVQEVCTQAEQCPGQVTVWDALEACSCAHHDDGSVTTMLCPTHASVDPCATMAAVTGTRRRGSVIKGVCSACGWSAS